MTPKPPPPEWYQKNWKSLKDWECRYPPQTFAEWYQREAGVSLDHAKRTRRPDLDLLEKAWKYGK